MSYTVPEPNSAQVYRSIADKKLQEQRNEKLKHVFQEIDGLANFGYGVYCTNNLDKEDVKELRRLGYGVHKELFMNLYYISW